jgi:AcrR family transcriptional regulator
MGKRNRREVITRAAEELFTSRRFHETTLDDVARQAGVGKGTIYRYFKDKDDLFFQTAVHGVDQLCDLLDKAVPGGAPFPRQLLVACEQISAFFHKRRPLFRVMQSEEFRMRWCRGELRSRWMGHRRRMASAVANVLRMGIEEGALRGDVPAELLTSILLGMLRAHARDSAEMPGESGNPRIVVDLFLRGAGADARWSRTVRRRLPAAVPHGGDGK